MPYDGDQEGAVHVQHEAQHHDDPAYGEDGVQDGIDHVPQHVEHPQDPDDLQDVDRAKDSEGPHVRQDRRLRNRLHYVRDYQEEVEDVPTPLGTEDEVAALGVDPQQTLEGEEAREKDVGPLRHVEPQRIRGTVQTRCEGLPNEEVRAHADGEGVDADDEGHDEAQLPTAGDPRDDGVLGFERGELPARDRLCDLQGLRGPGRGLPGLGTCHVRQAGLLPRGLELTALAVLADLL
mmetsp:Transcript_276/g.513  ORF Transcript_276/g.513 Transcript_276/m.513 type:complete len:235 (+) Transcript_276:970-1674(+)